MSKELPKCPGCGRDMLPDQLVDHPDRPFSPRLVWAWFECPCGWKSPEKSGYTVSEAFLNALEAATNRKEKDK